MSDKVRGMILAAVFFWTVLLAVFVYFTGRENVQFHEATKAEIETLRKEHAALVKRVAHMAYVNRRVEEYDRLRGQGVPAKEATKKASEVK